MFLVNHKRKIVYYAHGKVGSSSVAVTFASTKIWDQHQDWHDLTADPESQRTSMQLLLTQFADYTVYLLLRDPLKRYISGVKEELYGDHTWGVDLFTRIPLHKQLLSADYDYIQTEAVVRRAVRWYFKPLSGPRSPCSPSMNSFHLANWLYRAAVLCAHHRNIQLITTETLTQHVQDTHDIELLNRNVSPPGLTNRILDAVHHVDQGSTWQMIHSYLEPEQAVYQQLLAASASSSVSQQINGYTDYHDLHYISDMLAQLETVGIEL